MATIAFSCKARTNRGKILPRRAVSISLTENVARCFWERAETCLMDEGTIKTFPTQQTLACRKGQGKILGIISAVLMLR